MAPKNAAKKGAQGGPGQQVGAVAAQQAPAPASQPAPAPQPAPGAAPPPPVHDPKWHKNLSDVTALFEHNQAQVLKGRFKKTTPIPSNYFAIRKQYLWKSDNSLANKAVIWGKEAKEEWFVLQLVLWRRVSDHPFIVPILAWTIDRDADGSVAAYQAMPLIDHVTLHDLVEEWDANEDPDGTIGGLEEENYRKQMSTWTQQVALAVQYMHDKGVAHRSLHPRNILLQREPDRPWERLVKVADFGRAEELRVGTEEYDVLKAEDIRCIAYLHIFGTCGYYHYVDNQELPEALMQRVYPRQRLQDMSAAQWEDRKAERGFVIGVRDAMIGRLSARNLLCLPLFQGAMKDIITGAHPKWAVERPSADPTAAVPNPRPDRFKPVTGTINLYHMMNPPVKPKAGDVRKLRMRQGMRDALDHIQVTGHTACLAYPTMAPLSFACQGSAHNPSDKCPVGTLFDRAAFQMHGHPDAAAFQHGLTPNGPAAALARYELTRDADFRGRRNYIVSKSAAACPKCKQWWDVQVFANPSGGHLFRYRCEKCNEISYEVGEFYHLAELVEPRLPRSDRGPEPWMDLVSLCLGRTNPDATEIGKYLRRRNATWVEPTFQDFRNRGAQQ
ncbi:hypothetical protein AAVH_25933 [Aphelenchoides avenae]|nr:hypothetical protein AAVH_25933 [Aphelenchus avenae]